MDEQPAERVSNTGCGPYFWVWIGTNDYHIHVGVCAKCHLVTYTNEIRVSGPGTN